MRNDLSIRRGVAASVAAVALVGAVALAGSALAPAVAASTPPGFVPVLDAGGPASPAAPAAPSATDSAAVAGGHVPVHAAAPIDRSSRAAVVYAYRQVYLPAARTPLGWTGSVAGCRAGSVSSSAHSATLAMVNYFRSMGDLPPVTFDPVYSAKAQQAALMMTANQALDHSPPPSWRCWTADGADAAASSNLALGVGGASAIRLMMDDPGSSNTAVGHRRWILNPPALTMGSGSTSDANVLWVFGPEGDRPHRRAVEWPSAGYFPRELEPAGRWSASFPDADLSGATVRVIGPTGAVLPVAAHTPDWGYGDPTLVWEMGRLGEVAGRGDRTYRVEIRGIQGWSSTTHSYQVTLVDASPPVPHAPVGSLDEVVVAGNEVIVRGWAVDRNLPAGGLRVRARTEGSPQVWSTTVVGWLPRPGLANFGLPTAAGFEARARFAPGTYRICADALDHTGEQQTNHPTWLGCKEVVVK